MHENGVKIKIKWIVNGHGNGAECVRESWENGNRCECDGKVFVELTLTQNGGRALRQFRNVDYFHIIFLFFLFFVSFAVFLTRGRLFESFFLPLLRWPSRHWLPLINLAFVNAWKYDKGKGGIVQGELVSFNEISKLNLPEGNIRFNYIKVWWLLDAFQIQDIGHANGKVDGFLCFFRIAFVDSYHKRWPKSISRFNKTKHNPNIV